MAYLRSLPTLQLLITILGSASGIAVSLQLVELGWGTWVITWAVLANLLPSLIVAPLVAPLMDSLPLNRLGAAALGLEAVAAIVIVLLDTPPLLLGYVLAVGVLSCLTSPILLTLASEAESTAAVSFSKMDTARTLGLLVGPALGGLLFDLSGYRVPIVLEALALLFGAAVLFLMATPPTQIPREKSWRARILAAPRFLITDPSSRTALLVLTPSVAFTAVYSVANIFIARDLLGLTGVGYAVIIQCFVVGRIIGARLGSRISAALPTLIASSLAMGSGLVVAGISTAVFLVGLGFFVSGVANSVQVAALRLVIAAEAGPLLPKALSSVGSINSGAMLVGTVGATPLIDASGPSHALAIAGCGTIFAALAGAGYAKWASRS
ncbi:MFS transporter [Corynebacterium hindlerae]|uniref:MFS transporter n=1 Tax=Corynebacterium hindlerae TaxID=699041 RepID=UPI003AAE2752